MNLGAGTQTFSPQHWALSPSHPFPPFPSPESPPTILHTHPNPTSVPEGAQPQSHSLQGLGPGIPTAQATC